MSYFRLSAILLLVIVGPVHPAALLSQQEQRASQAPLALTVEEIAALVNECGQRTTRMSGRLYNYTFRETDIEYEVDKKGRPKGEQAKVFEVFPTAVGKGRTFIYVQVSENGVALSSERLARERERAARKTAELEQQSVTGQAGATTATAYKPRFESQWIRVEKHSGLSRTIWYIRPTDFLVWHEFFAPQRASIAGRDAILLRFRPRSGYVYDKTNVPYAEGVEDFGRAMAQLGGRIWIDALDKVIVRLEAKPWREMNEPDAAANSAPDANVPVWFEFARLPNGNWVPSQSRYNSEGRDDIFWKTVLIRSRKYSDFKLFKTTADVEQIDPPPARP